MKKLRGIIFVLCVSTFAQAMMQEELPLQQDSQEEEEVGCFTGLRYALSDGCKEPFANERDIKRHNGCCQNVVNRSSCFCSGCILGWLACFNMCCCTD